MEQAQFGWTLVYGFRTYFMDSGWLRVLTITQTLKTFLWLYLYVVLEHGRLSHVLPIAVHLPTVHWTVREGHSNSLLLFQFLAAKAQLNTCTFLLSVCLSVRLKTEFLPVLSLLGPCLVPAWSLWQLCLWQMKCQLMTACPWQLILPLVYDSWNDSLLMTAEDSLPMIWQLAYDSKWYQLVN